MSGASPAPAFELPNAGPGPDPCSLADLAAGNDFVVFLFHRDYYCRPCREQAKRVGRRYDAFRVRDAVAASVLPEDREAGEIWQDRFDLPFPLLVDEGADVAADYGQPVRLGFLGDWSDYLGRLPAVVVVDVRGGEAEIVWTYKGNATFDRPETGEILDAIDEARGV